MRDHRFRDACQQLAGRGSALTLFLLFTSTSLAQSTSSTAADASAAGSEGGLYLSLPWLVLFVISVCGWLYEVAWLKKDAAGVGLRSPQWVSGFMGGGILLVSLTFFIHPLFCLVLMVGSGVGLVCYLRIRNEAVPTQHQIFPSVLGRDEHGISGAGEEISARNLPHVDVSMRTSRGQSLDEFIDARPDFADAAEKLGDLLAHACESNAGALRLTHGPEAFNVFYRLDGVPQRVDTIPPQEGQQIVAAVANFLGFKGQKQPSVDVTLSLPNQEDHSVTVTGIKSKHGRGVTFQLPDWHEDIHLDGLEGLGMSEEMVERVHDAVDTPGTITLFSGPPASGRSSSYHAALAHIDIFTTEITVLETNPVHELDQITRHQVDVGSRSDVEELLPSVLRKGADVIGLDEITSPESVSSLLDFVTEDGRLLGTIEASSSPEALNQFVQPLDSAKAAQTLDTVISQRLVRTLCRNCRERYDPNPKMLKKLKISPRDVGTWYRAVGCDQCLQTGYRGQTGIFELLTINDAVRRLIASGQADKPGRIKKAAGKNNLTTLFRDALSRVQDGTTTLKEVRRVLK